jgi:hypothetical protein
MSVAIISSSSFATTEKSACESGLADSPATLQASATKYIERLTWSDRIKFKAVDHSATVNMVKQGLVMVVLGGSSVHGIFPNAIPSEDSISAKIYFKSQPKDFGTLARAVVDAALPSLKLILAKGDARDPILVVPSPGQVVEDGRKIQLPISNFGAMAAEPCPLRELIENELKRRSAELQLEGLNRVRVIIKNDSFSLAAAIGTRHDILPGTRIKLVFAGTGLGEDNILALGSGRFEELAVEGGHAHLNDYPGINVPAEFLAAFTVVQKANKEVGIPVEFENLVAGGGKGKHLGGILSVLLSHFLIEQRVPEWIRSNISARVEMQKTFFATLGSRIYRTRPMGG